MMRPQCRVPSNLISMSGDCLWWTSGSEAAVIARHTHDGGLGAPSWHLAAGRCSSTYNYDIAFYAVMHFHALKRCGCMTLRLDDSVVPICRFASNTISSGRVESLAAAGNR
jgi:hypothetical protein